MQAWKDDYPWLQLAFKHIGPGGRAASESWRARIEDHLDTTLDYKVRPDGTAGVWCGLSGHDFHHEPTPKELLEGLADAYRKEVDRLGLSPGPLAVVTRDGPVEISPTGRDELVAEIRRRDDSAAVAHAFDAAGPSSPVALDRAGKIVVFDALWALAEAAGGDDLLDPQLHLLRDRLRNEIAEGGA